MPASIFASRPTVASAPGSLRKAGRDLRVRVEGQLVLSASKPMLDSALSGGIPTKVR
jgi:hypothetical protein